MENRNIIELPDRHASLEMFPEPVLHAWVIKLEYPNGMRLSLHINSDTFADIIAGATSGNMHTMDSLEKQVKDLKKSESRAWDIVARERGYKEAMRDNYDKMEARLAKIQQEEHAELHRALEKRDKAEAKYEAAKGVLEARERENARLLKLLDKRKAEVQTLQEACRQHRLHSKFYAHISGFKAKEAEGIRKRMVKLEAENRTLKEQFTRWASFDIIGKSTTAPCLQVKCSYCRTYFNRIPGSELNYCPVCGARNEDVPVTNRAI